MFGHLANKYASILSHVEIGVAQSRQSRGEGFRLNYHLREVDAVFCDLSECRAHLPFELHVTVANKMGQVRHRSSINNKLRQLQHEHYTV